MFDGSYETFERLRRQDTVQIIAVRRRKVLMLVEKQPGMKQPRFGLPGGAVERGEKPLSAAKRELLEETGLSARRWELLHCYKETSDPKIDYKVYLFSARDCRAAVRKYQDDNERIALFWVAPERLFASFYRGKDDIFVDFLRIVHNSKKLSQFKKKIFN